MDTLLELEQNTSQAGVSLLQAFALSLFVTSTTVLGIAHGKHMDKTASHIEIPTIHTSVRTSRKMYE
jgi:hypothetical protein